MNEKKNRKIAIGADHAGFELKEYLKEYLKSKNIEVVNFGCNSTEPVGYPEFAFAVSKYISDEIKKCYRLKDEIRIAVEDETYFCHGFTDKGILICGSGSGMCITANKVAEIRAVNCYNSEIASLAVQHNDANILCLGARFINKELAKEIVDTFLEAEFEGGRHLKRVFNIHYLTER